MTTYYTVSGNPASHSFGSSAYLRTEYTLIQTAFATVNTEMTGKGAITGQVWTGTHDFSGATSVLVPTPTLNGQAVPKSYADALSVAAGNVPVGGTINQVLKKNSATNYDMSWATLTVNGAGGTTTTGSVTLTSSSSGALSATPSAPGLYVTLPVATTLTSSVNNFSIYNAGDFDYGVKDSAGTQLGWVRPRTGTIIGLADNSTAAGVWAPYGLEKTGSTHRSLLTIDASFVKPRITLDANRTFFILNATGATGFYGVVYDASTNTLGTPTLIRAGTNIFRNCVLQTTDRILVTSCPGTTTTLQAVVLSISGTTITVNSAVNFTLATTIAGSSILLTTVGTTFVVSYLRDTTNYGSIGITVSGTVPTFGSEAITATTTFGVAPIAAVAMGSTYVLVHAISTTQFSATPFAVSGTTLTIGTVATVTWATTLSPRYFQQSSGNLIIAYSNAAYTATILRLSGTTMLSSALSVNSSNTGGSATAVDLAAISSTKTLSIDFFNSVLRINILTDTGGTLSLGTPLDMTIGASSGFSILSCSSTTAVVAVSGTNTQATLITVSVSGTSPTLTSAPVVGGIGTVVPVVPISDPENSGRVGTRLQAGTNYFKIGGTTISRWAVENAAGLSALGAIDGTFISGQGLQESFVSTTIGGRATIARVEAAA